MNLGSEHLRWDPDERIFSSQSSCSAVSRGSWFMDCSPCLSQQTLGTVQALPPMPYLVGDEKGDGEEDESVLTEEKACHQVVSEEKRRASNVPTFDQVMAEPIISNLSLVDSLCRLDNRAWANGVNTPPRRSRKFASLKDVAMKDESSQSPASRKPGIKRFQKAKSRLEQHFLESRGYDVSESPEMLSRHRRGASYFGKMELSPFMGMNSSGHSSTARGSRRSTSSFTRKMDFSPLSLGSDNMSQHAALPRVPNLIGMDSDSSVDGLLQEEGEDQHVPPLAPDHAIDTRFPETFGELPETIESRAGVESLPKKKKTKKSGDKTKSKKRNKKSLEIKEEDKVFYEPTDKDVLFGRGPQIYWHPGNQRFLEEKDRLQPSYLAATKSEKKSISQDLVNVVHDSGGRFLDYDTRRDQWFEVLNEKARHKASQTLREDFSAEDRREKRQKYKK